MVSSSQVAEHVRSVHAIISRPQRPSGHELVARSWLRCFHELALDPAAEDAPPPLAPQAWRERGDRLGDVMDSAVPEMQTLHRQLDDPNSALVLADAEGVIVSIVRHPGFAREASLRGLVEGARWSEDVQGTNGIGTVLAERHSLVISREEHFFARHTGMVCAGAPIYDGVGEVAAILAACSLSPGGARALRALVERSARVIEHRAFRARHATDYIIRFHAHAGRVLTAVDGLLALTPEGEVIEANHTAFELLSPDGEALLGREVTEFFGQSLPELLSRTFRAGFHPLTLSMPQHQTWYLLAQQPARNRAQSGARGDSGSAAQALAELDLGDLRMAGNVHSAMRILDRDIPLLIAGETGTGKEVFARAFHASSQRARGPFVAINCASLPEALIESELFGYKQGAFTGANRDGRRGKVLQADGGTLFLDEIGDMPLQLQARLLRVLEERKVTPLGGENAVPVDLQLVCATHRDLRAMVRDGSFREDLYYRLRGMEVTLPPLRERTDRRALIERCLNEEGAGRHPPVRLGQAAMQVLDRYRWPGNIRQLRYVLRTLVAMCDGGEITLRDMPAELMDAPEPMPAPPVAALPAADSHADVPPPSPTSHLNPLQSAERDALLAELRRHRWNIAGLARELGVSRNTVYRKMKRLDIDTDTQAGDGY